MFSVKPWHVAATALLVSACSGNPAEPVGPTVSVTPPTPAPQAVDSPQPASPVTTSGDGTATLPPLQTAQDVELWMNGRCFAFAKESRHIACAQAELEMGFIAADVRILDANAPNVNNGDEPKVVAKYVVYSGHAELDPSKLNADAIEKANAKLKAGGFHASGSTVDRKKIVRTADGYFRMDTDHGSHTAKLPQFTAAVAPAGFKGDINACLKWVPSVATTHKNLTAVRLWSDHSFTNGGGPCGVPVGSEVNDETYPMWSRWLFLYAK